MASEKTKGIVLHALKYSDTSTVVTVYTERFGRVAYMVYGVGGKRAVCRPALLQPLSLVELEVAHHPGKDMQRIREMRMAYPLEGIPFDPVKNSIALFLSEVLYRVLRRSEPDGELYAFLERSILRLDSSKGRLADFHLLFLTAARACALPAARAGAGPAGVASCRLRHGGPPPALAAHEAERIARKPPGILPPARTRLQRSAIVGGVAVVV